MITVHDVEQGTPEWHELRTGRYTGSNAHKLLRYGARPYSLTESSEFKGNFHTKRGHVLEDEAIEFYEIITKSKVQRPGFITNDLYPECGYSPDGMHDPILLEVKCFNETKHLTINKTAIPLEIMAQIHFGFLITELRKARLILYHPKLDPKLALKIIDIKANPAILSNFKRILTAPRKETSYAHNN